MILSNGKSKALDYLFSTEESDSYYFGVEGETYTIEGGKPKLNVPGEKWYENRVEIRYANNIPRYDSIATIYGDLDENSQTTRAMQLNTQ